ncbi:MAG: SRPBCC family protein [Pseudomonadota bacterium]
MTNSVQFHRVLKAPISRVFRAFSNPEAKATWLPPFGFICQVHSFNFNVGGNYKMTFLNFTNEQRHSWSGTFTEIKVNKCIIYKDKFDDPNLSGEMTVTISFKEVSCGTELIIKQEGIPVMIPTEMCYLGWQESLIKLAQLVEPEINS